MKLRQRISLVLTICMITIMLSACGGNDTTTNNKQETANNSEKSNAPISASEAFDQEGIWFISRYSDDSGAPVTKEKVIDAVLVFDGKGNVTRYDATHETEYVKTTAEYLHFGDLKDLSEEEILNIAKEQDKKMFELYKQDALLSLESFTEFGPNGDYSLVKTKIEETEYQEPEAKPFTLKIKTDGTGNQTAEEKLVYSYSYVRLIPLEENWTTSWIPQAETADNITLMLNPYAGNSTVYDMQFTGFGSINKLIGEGSSVLMLDTPDAEGVEVD